MNLPQLYSYEDCAIDTVVSVINRAKERLGNRQTLRQLVWTRKELLGKQKVSLANIKTPLEITTQKFIAETIEKKWRLTPTLAYDLKYVESSEDVCTQYLYYEAVFSQPTAAYPIPQATVSVFFRLENKLVEPPDVKDIPTLFFRIEGHTTDHDVQFMFLTVDWILAEIQMKIKLYKRIEAICLF